VLTSNKGWFDLLNEYKEILADLFIVSKADIELTSADQLPAVKESEEEKQIPVAVKVAIASGAKCQRCWRFDTNLGTESEFPDICERCTNVMRRP
jgi:isoleucyl-tRNA synthetase